MDYAKNTDANNCAKYSAKNTDRCPYTTEIRQPAFSKLNPFVLQILIRKFFCCGDI